MNFLFQLFELGSIDARGELTIANMTISKPPMTNDIFTSNFIIAKRDNQTNHDDNLLYKQMNNGNIFEYGSLWSEAQFLNA